MSQFANRTLECTVQYEYGARQAASSREQCVALGFDSLESRRSRSRAAPALRSGVAFRVPVPAPGRPPALHIDLAIQSISPHHHSTAQLHVRILIRRSPALSNLSDSMPPAQTAPQACWRPLIHMASFSSFTSTVLQCSKVQLTRTALCRSFINPKASPPSVRPSVRTRLRHRQLFLC